LGKEKREKKPCNTGGLPDLFVTIDESERKKRGQALSGGGEKGAYATLVTLGRREGDLPSVCSKERGGGRKARQAEKCQPLNKEGRGRQGSHSLLVKEGDRKKEKIFGIRTEEAIRRPIRGKGG